MSRRSPPKRRRKHVYYASMRARYNMLKFEVKQTYRKLLMSDLGVYLNDDRQRTRGRSL